MLIVYRCVLCGNSIQKLFGTKDKCPSHLNCECGGILEKQLPDFSTSSFETVDNGNMAREVELRKDATKKAKEKGDIYIKNLDKRERPLKKDDI